LKTGGPVQSRQAGTKQAGRYNTHTRPLGLLSGVQYVVVAGPVQEMNHRLTAFREVVDPALVNRTKCGKTSLIYKKLLYWPQNKNRMREESKKKTSSAVDSFLTRR